MVLRILPFQTPPGIIAAMDDKGHVARAAGKMSTATMVSRVLGYVRDMLFGALFGAGNIMDAYLVAFRIPNLFREVFAEGSMSAAFVPVLTETQARSGEDETRKVVRITFTFILTAVGGFCLVGMFFTPALVSVIAPGWLDEPEKFRSTVLLARIMFPFLLFVSLAAMAMGTLNTRGVFFIPALAPAVLNVVTIGVVLLLFSRVSPPIMALAIGVALGGVAQFGIQLPPFFSHGFSLKPLFQFNHPDLRKMFALALPVVLAMSTNQINIFVTNILASYLPEGSITYLYYSMRLIHLPIGVFGVAMAVAVLPTLSRQAVAGDMNSLRDTFSFAVRLLFFITLPAMAGLIALRVPIVSTLFQYGRFGADGVAGTASALLFYSMGIWSMVGMRVAASAFYSMQDTRTPVRIAVMGLLSNVLLSLGLMRFMGHNGLALANAVASAVQFVLLLYYLRRKMGGIDGRRIAYSFLRNGAIAAFMAGACWLALRNGPWLAGSGSPWQRVAYLAAGLGFGASLYTGIARLSGGEELRYLLQLLKSRRSEDAQV